MIELRQHLENMTGDDLKGFLKLLHISQQGLTRKAHFIEAVEKQLTGQLPTVLRGLSDPERLWLADSAHAGRFVGHVEFKARFGAQWPWRQRPGSWSYGTEPTLLDAMVYRDQHLGRNLMVPSLVEPLKANLPRPEIPGMKTVKELPLNPSRTEGSNHKPLQVFVSDIAPMELGRVLRLVQSGKVKVTDSTRRATDASTRLVSQALVAPDFVLERPAEAVNPAWMDSSELVGSVRAHAWGALVQQCGWAKAKGSVLTLTSSGQQILSGFVPRLYQAGVARFIANGDFDELHRVNHIRGQTGKYSSRYISCPSDRKSAICKVLAQWPQGEWLEYSEALRSVNAFGGDWDVMKASGFLFLCEAEYGSINDVPAVSSQYLRALLMESLATLGLVDIGYVYPHGEWPDLRGQWGADEMEFLGRYDGLRYVRLSPLGAFCFGVNTNYTPQVAERTKLFRVLANHELVLTEARIDPGSRAMLELMAVPQTDVVWRLDADRILSHVEAGGSFPELTKFLQAQATDVLPENVQVFLRDLESKLGACQGVRSAFLIDWNDEATARLVANSTGLRKVCRYAGGNTVAVSAADYRTFARLVKKLGYVVPSQ